MKHKIVYTADRKTRGTALLIFLLIAGIAAGSVYAARGGNAALPWVNQYFSPVYSGNTAAAVFCNTLLSSALFITAAFLFGLWAAAAPIGAAMMLCRGVAVGASAASMYLSGGLSALPAVLVLLVPKAAAMGVVSLLAVRELLRSSVMLLGFFLRGEADRSRDSARLYLIKYGVLLLISILISGADAAMNYFFAGLL